MYQEVLKAAESTSDSSKARRYKRSIDTIIILQRDAKAGRPVDMELLPPIIATPTQAGATPTSSVTMPTIKPSPVKPAPAGNLIDLDDSEFDEFNLSEEDMASLMVSLPSVPLPTKPTPPPLKPKPQTTPTTDRPPGIIDLDTPEFAEFDLSEEDMALLAAQMNIHKMPEPAPPPDKTTQSLPAKFVRPVGVAGGVTKEQVKAVLVERKDQYMKAMKVAKVKGDTKTQKQYGTVAVQFDRAIKSLDQGEPLDLLGTPPPPPGYTSQYNINITLYKSPTPTSGAVGGSITPTSGAVGVSPQSSVTSQQGEESDPAIPIPRTPMDALQQRLEKYREGIKSAQEKGESSRARRLGRITKQYEDAIKSTKAGKPVDYDELPVPPGYPPIPAGRPQVRPVQSLPASVPQSLRPKVSVNDKQVQTLKQRGTELQRAAREAKGRGDKEKTLMYLRYYKAIEQMLLVAEGGMPVDMTQVMYYY